jgi:hypothetical protein
MYVTLQSSTCFEHQHAHLQEDKLYYHSIWYRHSLYSTVQCVCYITILDMSRTLTCPSSGGQIVLSQHLVSSISLQYSTVCRMSRLLYSLLSSGILYSRLQRVTVPDAVIIQFVLLKMGMLMLETCRGF